MSLFAWRHARNVVAFLLVVVLVIGSIITAAWKADDRACRTKAEGYGFAYDHDLWAGCRFLIDDRWIPEDRLTFLSDGTILERITNPTVPA